MFLFIFYVCAKKHVHLLIMYLLYDECVNNTWLLETVFIAIENMKVCMIILHVHHSVPEKLENNLQISN